MVTDCPTVKVTLVWLSVRVADELVCDEALYDGQT
jgi:hypothetical protein